MIRIWQKGNKSHGKENVFPVIINFLTALSRGDKVSTISSSKAQIERRRDMDEEKEKLIEEVEEQAIQYDMEYMG